MKRATHAPPGLARPLRAPRRDGSVRRAPGRLRLAALVLAPVLLGASPAAAGGAEPGLSPEERRIVDWVEAHEGEALALLEEAVETNSGTMSFAGVRRVGDLFAERLAALGFTTRWVEGAPFERAGHLFATRPGGEPHVLLIGHLDTVFEADSPFQRWEPLGDGWVRGPGIADMKGGDVILVQALGALHAAGGLDRLTVTVALIGDEEKTGRPLELGRRDLREAADAADVAIAFENGDNRVDTAVVARRGSTSWRLEVAGRPAHSSQIFRDEVGAGAIFEAARILDRFRSELAGERHLTFNPGAIVGGTEASFDAGPARGEAFGKNNVVAERAIVTGDLRTISPEQLARAKRRMQAAAADSLPHTSATLTFDDSYPPMPPSEGNLRLLAMLDRVSRDLGHGPVTAVDPSDAGAADVAFTAGRVEMAIDGLGLLGRDEHTVEETADLATLRVQTARAALLLNRLAGGG